MIIKKKIFQEMYNIVVNMHELRVSDKKKLRLASTAEVSRTCVAAYGATPLST
jgi:hypothetical protein